MRKLFKVVLTVCLILFLLPVVFAIPPTVYLLSPADKSILTASNVGFVCNASDEERVDTVILYTNSSGTFSPSSSIVFGELEEDEHTLLLCHFNNNYTCVDGEVPQVENVTFDKSLLLHGASFNESSRMKFDSSSNINLTQGTIEFWFKVNSFNYYNYNTLFKLGDGSENYINEIEIYIYPYSTTYPEFSEEKLLYFIVYDPENSMYIEKNVSTSLYENEWHHLAVTWNISKGSYQFLEMYFDGEYSNVSDFGFLEFLSGYMPQHIYVARDDYFEEYFFNGTIDELRISKTVRSGEEILEAYQNASKDYTNVSFSTSLVLEDGAYEWNCLAVNNNSESSWAASNYTFTIDTRPPAIENVTTSPSTPADLDPGVTINVSANITDPHDVSTVILQWKKVGNWNNVTMQYDAESKKYSASFSTDSLGGIYFYRIWSNDTLSNAGYSETFNLTVDWDFTWHVDPTNFSVSGPLDAYASYFITLNNTGDDTLGFTLSHNWIREVYFNSSLDTFSFYVENKSSAAVNVTFRLLEYSGEMNTYILINASHSYYQPQPASTTVPVIINSYEGGPCLTTTITNYSSVVAQNDTVSITGKIKNIGNETATGTVAIWILSPGWINISTSLENYLGDISPGSTEWVNITLFVDPSAATAGIVSVGLNASCEEGVYGYDSKSIGVNCNSNDGVCGLGCTYATDDDCPITYVSLPPEVSTYAKEEKRPLLKVPAALEIKRGTNESFLVNVTNPSSQNIYNLSLVIGGNISNFIKILQPNISVIKPNSTHSFQTFVEIPPYLGRGRYTLSFVAKGVFLGKPIIMAADVIIEVHEVSRGEALECINKSVSLVSEMDALGFNTRLISLLLSDAHRKLSLGGYEEVKELCERIEKNKEYAINLKSMLDVIENNIKKSEENGLKVVSTKNMLTMSRSAFLRGDFETAIKRVEDTQNVLYIETFGKVNYLKLILDNWHYIVLGTIASVATAYAVRVNLERRHALEKIKRLRNEEFAILQKMSKIREKAFREYSISMADYHKAMYEYQKRLTEVRREMAKLRSRRITGVKGLEKEKEDIEKMIKKLQDEYFKKKSIGKGVYEERLKVLIESLADIEMQIKNLESGAG